MLKQGQHFTEEQVEFLTSEATLVRWAAKSLQERVQLFKCRYPTAKITVYKLRRLYYKKKIKMKVIRFGKVPRQAHMMDIVVQAAELRQDIKLAMERRLRIIQLDEFVITKKTWQTHAWSR